MLKCMYRIIGGRLSRGGGVINTPELYTQKNNWNGEGEKCWAESNDGGVVTLQELKRTSGGKGGDNGLTADLIKDERNSGLNERPTLFPRREARKCLVPLGLEDPTIGGS